MKNWIIIQGIMTKSKNYILNWLSGCHFCNEAKQYVTSVSNILHDDYKSLKCDEFDDIYAWDTDKYEKSKRSGHSEETVDMVIALDYGKLLMTEAKLNVKKIDNLKGEIEDKISHTKDYIASSINFKYCVPSIVLINAENFQSKYNRFRKLRNDKNDIIPMTLHGFYNYLIENMK